MTAEETEREVEGVESRVAVKSRAPDGGYGWVVLVASFVSSIIIPLSRSDSYLLYYLVCEFHHRRCHVLVWSHT